VAVVIRLQRAGTRNRPFFRVVVADSRRARDGAFIERLGYYDPLPDPDVISIDRPKLDAWVGKGATPSEAVRVLVHRLGLRQKAEGAPVPTVSARRKAAKARQATKKAPAGEPAASAS
jgi:small subunit ribosomal protein S16